MGGIINSIDTVVELHSDHPDLQGIVGEQAVVELEVERIYMGGGSTAEVTIVYPEDARSDDLYNLKQIITDGPSFRNMCGVLLPESVYNKIRNNENISPGDVAQAAAEENAMTDKIQSLVDGNLVAGVNDHPLDISIDIEVENLSTGSRVDDDRSRVFTGHVIGVTEAQDGTVTFTAMDGRHYLNKNMVSVDPGEDGQYPVSIVMDILEEIGYIPEWTGDAGDNYQYDTAVNAGDRIHDTWGVDSNVTAFEALRDLARRVDGWIHIDEFNNLHFRGVPQISSWGEPDPTNKTFPPIIEYDSGGKESSENVIVESSYDETGLTPFVSLGDETVSESGVSMFVGKKISDQNVFSRKALEKQRDWEIVQSELITDSGTVRVVGDPRFEPKDQVILTENIITEYSPIADGTYTAKTVRHIVDGSEGYVTELELGKDIESLYEQIVEKSKNAEETREQMNQQIEEPEDDGGGGIWSSIKNADFSFSQLR